jgi:hypothetical protein
VIPLLGALAIGRSIPEVPIARIGSVDTTRDTYDNLSPPLCPGHLYPILAVIVLFFEELPTGRNF